MGLQVNHFCAHGAASHHHGFKGVFKTAQLVRGRLARLKQYVRGRPARLWHQDLTKNEACRTSCRVGAHLSGVGGRAGPSGVHKAMGRAHAMPLPEWAGAAVPRQGDPVPHLRLGPPRTGG